MNFPFSKKLSNRSVIGFLLITFCVGILIITSAFKDRFQHSKTDEFSSKIFKRATNREIYPLADVTFDTMRMRKRDVDSFMTEVLGFTHFVFQNHNRSNNPKRERYELVFYSYESIGQRGPHDHLLKPHKKSKIKTDDAAFATYTKLSRQEIQRIIPDGLAYRYLMFAPVECAPKGKYICYKVYPGDANGDPVNNAKSSDKINYFDKVEPALLNPSPPATSD